MKNFIKNRKKIFFLLFLGILIFAFQVSAMEIDWPPSFTGTDLTDASTLPELIKYFYEWGISLGGLAVFIALLIAGFQYLTSTGNVEAMRQARDKITSAFYGLILLLSSWLILNTINPELTTFHQVDSPFLSGPNVSETYNCDADDDCVSPLVCSDPFDDGVKEGFCIPAITPETCKYATIYVGPGFTVGVITSIGKGQLIAIDLDDHQAIQSFDKNNVGLGPFAGGCMLELYGGSAFFSLFCYDKMSSVPAYQTDISTIPGIDKPIKCVKLVGP